MISLIVCSIRDDLYERFSASLMRTIGVPYEIIRIDNKLQSLSICAAYNKGAQCASFEYLIFIHEDVTFETDRWGEALVRHFLSLTNVGVLGVAGSDHVLSTPCGWWDAEEMNRFAHIIDGAGAGVHHRINATNPRRVVTLDGVFLATTKKFFERIRFDESIAGFHAYDLSFCINASSSGACNYFVHDILLRHHSSMTPDKQDYSFFANNLQVKLTYADRLPITYSKRTINSNIEAEVAYENFRQILKLNVCARKKARLVGAYYSWNSKNIGLIKTSSLLAKSIIRNTLATAGWR